MDDSKTASESPVRVSCVSARRQGVIAVAGKLSLRQLAFTPAQVVAASATNLAEGVAGYGGVYFLLWRGSIVYVGKAATLWARLNAHHREGRPHDAIAVIAGLPAHVAAAVEDCYARAWEPPWNGMTTSGYHRDSKRLFDALDAMDTSLVMPWFTPSGGPEMTRLKPWQLHVMGYRQADAA